MEKINTDILILGAGWSGLVAADLFSKSAKTVVILEKDARVGGLARTFDFKGFKFDIGGHGLFFRGAENTAYVQDILGDNALLTLKRKVKILFNNAYVDYPPGIRSIAKLDKKHIGSIILDALRVRTGQGQDNFEEWVKYNYGEFLYNSYFRDYTEKVWGKQCSELSASWADKRIGSGSLFKFIKGICTGDGSCKENNRSFLYPGDGICSLPDSLAEKMRGSSRIYKNARLKRWSIEGNRLVSLSFHSPDGEYEIFFKHAVSSIPLAELINVFPPALTTEISGIRDSIKYRNLILVSFILNKELATGWDWCYFPSPDIVFSRVHEPKFWSRGMAPEGNKTLLCAEIFCDFNDRHWNMPDAELVRSASCGLRAAGIINNMEGLSDACVKRIEYAYPLHYCGFEKPLLRVKDFLGTFNNLWLAGRSGTHSYFDMEDSLENVKDVVASMLDK